MGPPSSHSELLPWMESGEDKTWSSGPSSPPLGSAGEGEGGISSPRKVKSPKQTQLRMRRYSCTDGDVLRKTNVSFFSKSRRIRCFFCLEGWGAFLADERNSLPSPFPLSSPLFRNSLLKWRKEEEENGGGKEGEDEAVRLSPSALILPFIFPEKSEKRGDG